MYIYIVFLSNVDDYFCHKIFRLTSVYISSRPVLIFFLLEFYLCRVSSQIKNLFIRSNKPGVHLTKIKKNCVLSI